MNLFFAQRRVAQRSRSYQSGCRLQCAMQRANSSEPIVDLVCGSTHLPSDGEKRWKAARLYEAPSSITFLFFLTKRIRNPTAMRNWPSAIRLAASPYDHANSRTYFAGDSRAVWQPENWQSTTTLALAHVVPGWKLHFCFCYP